MSEESPLILPTRPPGAKSMSEKTMPSVSVPAEVVLETPPVETTPLESAKTRGEVKPPNIEIDDFSLEDKPPAKKEVPLIPAKKEVTLNPAKPSKEDNVRELAKLREKAEKDLEEARAKIKELETGQSTRIAELETLVEKTAFESSPRFKNNYLAPIEDASKAVVDFVVEMGEDPTVAEKILSLKGKERIEYLEATFSSATIASEALRLAKTYSDKVGAKETAIVNYKSEQALVQKEETQAIQKEEKKLEQNFATVLEKLVPKVSLLRKIDGDDEHNNLVEERIKTARMIMLGTAKQDDILLAPFLAVTCKDYIRRNAELTTELAKYKARVKEESSERQTILVGNTGDAATKKGPQGMGSRVGLPSGAR